MKSRCLLLTAMFIGGLATSLWAQDSGSKSKQPNDRQPAEAKPKIQMAILLDTSNSMDGLINQARTQLWKIVNEFAKAKRGGQTPELEVALFEYGKSTIDAGAGHLRLIVPLTDDLDKISQELFALTTNGGNEYCGMVIEAAVKRLKWSKSDDTLKCVFVAGNEPFTQGPVDPYQACQTAVKQGVTVSTIFCGPLQAGVNTGWQKGAQLADGSFVSIDQDKQVAAISTPQDKELAKLSVTLNETYLFYGQANRRLEREKLQAAQDQAAAKAAPAAAAGRAEFKAGGFYNNSKYDLVDALKKNDGLLKDLKAEELPKQLQGKSEKEQRAYIDAKTAERKKIQERIRELSEARKKYIAQQQARAANAAVGDTLDTAIIKAVRQQATKRNFKFEGK